MFDLTCSIPFRTRMALREDLVPMFECYRRAMHQYVDLVWGWDEAFQRNSFMGAVAPQACRVIEIEGQFAGFVWIQRTGPSPVLRLICLEPEHRGRTIGSRLLSALVVRMPGLRLKVLKVNPARAWYERMGFVVVTEDAHSVEMVHGLGVVGQP